MKNTTKEILMHTCFRRSVLILFVLISLACSYEKNSVESNAPQSLKNADISSARILEGGSGYLSKMTSSRDAYAENLKTSLQQLIYNAEIEISVKDFQKAEGEIKIIAEKAEGYIQDTKTFKKNDGKMHGTIKIRVPSDRFKEVLKSLSALGEVRSQREWTEDVTEEYIDVTARIENTKKLEERLLGLLDKKGATLTEIISVENKLTEVRTQIEQFEGKLRYLKSRINFSTITITIYEPQSALAEQESVFYPIIWAARQLGIVFFGSIGIFVIIVAGIVPWVLVILGIIKIVRFRRRKNNPQS